MTQPDIEREIKRITAKIVKEFDPEQVILFGSWAWGSPHPNSDIDLLVVKESKKKTLDLMKEVNRITYDREIALDTLVYTPDQCRRRTQMGDPFIKKIMKEGKVLYDRSSSSNKLDHDHTSPKMKRPPMRTKPHKGPFRSDISSITKMERKSNPL